MKPETAARWETARIRFKARVNPKATLDLDPSDQVSFVPMEAVGDDGSLVLDRTRAVAEVSQGYTYFEDGDVSIAKITPCFENGKGAVMDGLVGGAGFGTTELIVIRPEEDVSPRFLYYVTQSDHFRRPGEAAMLGSGGQKRVPDLFVKDFATQWPARDLQGAIAAYLDAETARIDGLIEEKTTLLQYLQEIRAAVIVAAMLQGAQNHQLLGYRNAPWMGRLPSHWKRMTLTRVVESACDGPFGSSLKSEHYTDEGIPVIRLQNIGDGEFLTGDPAFISDEYFRGLGGHDAAPGDMVVASLGDERRSPGRACVVPTSLGQALVKADCFRFRLDPTLANSDFVAMQLNSLCRPFFQFTAKGTTRQRVTISDVRRCPIALPSLDEQERVVEVVRAEQRNVARLISHVERELDLLSELRSATITDAVIGRIDVRSHMKN